MTHGPPQNILDECMNGFAGCKNLLRAVSRCKPRMHCFGHIHEGHGASKIEWKEDTTVGLPAVETRTAQENSYPEADKWTMHYGKETLMVNAAIMDGSRPNVPTNAPFLLDLEMPRAI